MNVSTYRPNKLLCVVAHPDDVEVTVGGTIAKWVAEGTQVCLVVCTDGANGTDQLHLTGKDISKQRAHEQYKAMQVLGINCCHQLHYQDGTIELTNELRRDIVEQIRAHKPDAVYTMDPSFLYSANWGYPNHRDHRVVGQATFDAVYPMARDVGTFPELLEDNLEPHAPSTLLMTNYENQNCYIDISDSFDKKSEALKAHQSQFGDAAGIIERMVKLTESNGQEVGVEKAEAFVKLDIF